MRLPVIGQKRKETDGTDGGDGMRGKTFGSSRATLRLGGVVRRGSLRPLPALLHGDRRFVRRDGGVDELEVADADVRQAHRDDLRDALFGHRDAVDDAGVRDRVLVVGDDEELRLDEEVLQRLDEASDVGVVEGRIELVEQAEGARLDQVDREEEADGRHRSLAA